MCGLVSDSERVRLVKIDKVMEPMTISKRDGDLNSGCLSGKYDDHLVKLVLRLYQKIEGRCSK